MFKTKFKVSIFALISAGRFYILLIIKSVAKEILSLVILFIFSNNIDSQKL